jgi:hypothetical protein
MKALSFLGLGRAPIPSEVAAFPSRDDVAELLAFISRVLERRLPTSIVVPVGRGVKLHWRMGRFDHRWYDGGAFRGSLYLGRIPLGPFHILWTEVTVTAQELARLVACLEQYYEADA